MEIKSGKVQGFNGSVAYFIALIMFFVGMWLLFFVNDNYKKVNPELKPSNEISSTNTIHPKVSPKSGKISEDIFSSIQKNLKHSISILLIQIIVVLLFARVFTIIFRKINQPSVIGEIVAGIALGPSLLGYLFPEVAAFIFPKSSLPNLQLLSQVGLIFFMFIIGMELDVGVLKQKAQSAVLISHMSIIFPFISGSILALYLFDRFAPPNISFLSFGLFMGIAMSVTAFPVLARIVQEKNLTRSPLGIIAITSAAVDDLSAWSILALIIAVVQATSVYASIATLGLTITFILFMVYIVQPFLNRMSKVYVTQEFIGRGVLSIVSMILLGSALVTEFLGIHALFGAFLAGVIMPTNTNLRKTLTEKFEDFSTVVLLPLFFAFTGIRTQINLLSSPELWITSALVIATATIGKFGASFASAKYSGMSWRDSAVIGALMNTRGLMELIVLNIGYDLGILSPEIFAMMVLMALVTTFATGPIVSFLLPKAKGFELTLNKIRESKALIAFGPPRSGAALFRLAFGIFGKSTNYTALHISPIPDKLSIEDITAEKADSFELIRKDSIEKKANLHTIHLVTSNIIFELVNTIQKEPYSLVLMGAAQQVFGDNIIGGNVDSIISGVNCKVGIFVDKGLNKIESLIIYSGNEEEAHTIFEIGGLIQKSGTTDITLLYEKIVEPTQEIVKKYFPYPVRMVPTDKNSKKVLEYSLLIIGYKHWIELSHSPADKFQFDKNEWLKDSNTSILILRSEIKN